MRRQKSLRIGVYHADGVVWGPVYRTRLTREPHVDRAVRGVERAVNLAHLGVDVVVPGRGGRERRRLRSVTWRVWE